MMKSGCPVSETKRVGPLPSGKPFSVCDSIPRGHPDFPPKKTRLQPLPFFEESPTEKTKKNYPVTRFTTNVPPPKVLLKRVRVQRVASC